MADETPDANELKETGDAALFAQNALAGFSNVAESSRNVLENLNHKISQFKTGLEATGDLSRSASTSFGLLSVAIIGTRKAFDNLAGVDTSGLNTFASQINDLQRTILEDSSLPTMADKATKMAASLVGLGVPVEKIKDLLEDGAEAVFGYASKLAESADNGLRLQNAYLQLSAATGNLGAVYAAAGPSLENINALLGQQQKVMTEAGAATGTSAEVVSQYYAQLATVPGALTSTVTGLSSTGEKTGMLTAAMRVATGSGRAFSEVVDDMKVAFRNYNITGEDALTFTTRISELSNKFGIELDDVRDALRSTSDQFKIFGNEAEGAARIYNDYLGVLQKTGISGNVAIDVVQGMVSGIRDLGIAQKGFLSAQTGGAGGLMGAFQIEKELRDGKIDKVFDRVRQSLGRQFGNIVSLEEASQSQSAAAQLTKQIQVLRQGALGSFAKDDQSAIRILEAFRKRERGEDGGRDLSQTALQDTANAGMEIQKKSYTELTRIRQLFESARNNANITNLDFIQGISTAGTGSPRVDGEQTSLMRDNLGQAMKMGAKLSGEAVSQTNVDMANNYLKNRTSQFSAQVITDFGKIFDELGPAVRAPVEELRNLISSGQTSDAQNTYQQYLAKLDEQKKEAMTLTGQARDKELAQIENDRKGLSQSFALLTKNKDNLRETAIDSTKAATSVGSAALLSVNNKPTPTIPTTPPLLPPINSTSTNVGELTVQIEGYCLECGDKIKGKSQSYAVNVGQKVQK